MPKRAASACLWPGCAGLAVSGGWCDEHQAVKRRQMDERRGSSHQRGYGARWRRLRGMVLAARPICVDPYQVHGGQVVAATDVDHIVPRSAGGGDTFENLQPLCHACHSRKTAEQSLRWTAREGRVESLQPGEQRPAAQPRARSRGLEGGGDVGTSS